MRPFPRTAAMALKSSVFKADLQVADLDRNYYAGHALTLARHPSETDERMMVRLLAFALHAHERLAFCKGLSDADEPDLWRRDLTGAIEQWIETGLPDDRRIARACGRAAQVVVVAYGAGAPIWWKQTGAKLGRHDRLVVMALPAPATQTLATLVQRSMKLQCTIQDGHLWLSDGTATVAVEPEVLFGER
jgi:uncharacterized protein YaeQ